MDSLISSFVDTSLGGGVKKLDGTLKVYISEVSSPTRLWIQLADTNSELDKMTVDIGLVKSLNKSRVEMPSN